MPRWKQTTYYATWCNPTLCGTLPPRWATCYNPDWSCSYFKSLINDELFIRHRIKLEIEHAKNDNKNPVDERAIQELEDELLRKDLCSAEVSSRLLAVATATLNTRICSRGLFAREMWTQIRDQEPVVQSPISANPGLTLIKPVEFTQD